MVLFYSFDWNMDFIPWFWFWSMVFGFNHRSHGHAAAHDHPSQFSVSSTTQPPHIANLTPIRLPLTTTAHHNKDEKAATSPSITADEWQWIHYGLQTTASTRKWKWTEVSHPLSPTTHLWKIEPRCHVVDSDVATRRQMSTDIRRSLSCILWPQSKYPHSTFVPTPTTHCYGIQLPHRQQQPGSWMTWWFQRTTRWSPHPPFSYMKYIGNGDMITADRWRWNHCSSRTMASTHKWKQTEVSTPLSPTTHQK